MKRIVLAAAASVAALVAAAPASAATYFQSLGAIIVPPDAFFGPSQLVSAGTVDLYYSFTLTSAFSLPGNIALNGVSFTSTNPNAVTFNTVGLYTGLATPASTGTPGGTRLSGTPLITSDASGTGAGYAPVTLAAGNYTIYVGGTASTTNLIGSSIRFTNTTAAVPEPATWGLMLLGFGMVGLGLRARRNAKVTFA